jgi:hypothetical protein
VAGERAAVRRNERLLAYGAVTGFLALVIAAMLLWAREGNAVYLARIISDLPNCF